MAEKFCKAMDNKNGGGKLIQRGNISTGNYDIDSSALCVQVSNKKDVLVGSEQGCVLVSLDGTILSPFETGQDGGQLGEVPSAIFQPINCDLVFVASEAIIHAYDTRKGVKPIFSLRENTEEVNQLCIQGEHLSSCDDSGEVKIFDLSTRKSFRTLRNKHNNICYTICFRHSAQKELISGGLDCQLILWNYSKIKVLDTSNTRELFRAIDGESSTYMCNPPMVNAIDCSNDGEVLACGTGNGCIVLYELTKGRRLKPYDILRSHSSLGVSCLNIYQQNDNRYLLSGGNDCKLTVKDIKKKPSEKTEGCSTTDSSVFLPSKVNNLTSFAQDDKLFHLICDQSNHLKLYEQVLD